MHEQREASQEFAQGVALTLGQEGRAAIRIAELEKALRNLRRECVLAGFDRARDYNWPDVMEAAEKALNGKL